MVSLNLIVSPFAKHNFLLSSSTVFIFSIQRASTGPSKITHFLEYSSPSIHSRKITAVIPSCHSLVASSTSPYNNFGVMDFGLIGKNFIGPVYSIFSRLFPRVSIIVVFPETVPPTTIRPCLTLIVSKSWMIF
jgi:hypothetical protein